MGYCSQDIITNITVHHPGQSSASLDPRILLFCLTEAAPYISFKAWKKNAAVASPSQKQHVMSYS